MKITFFTSLLLISSLSQAQTASKDLSISKPKSTSTTTLGISPKPTAIDRRDLSVSKKEQPGKSDELKQQSKRDNSERMSRMGSEGVGGGNGAQSANGEVTPLDVLFAQENRSVDVKTEYPIAYKAFQRELEKIRKAIPSFAKDIEETFSSLQWTLTKLDMGSTRCMNNTGVFKMRSGDKQVIIACQDQEGEVILSEKKVQALKKPEYLGVVFLHESFVKRMLGRYSTEEDYHAAEEKMITKVTPYIWSNQTLDPARLYAYTETVGYSPLEYDTYNKYAVEAFPDVRAEYEKKQAEVAAIDHLIERAQANVNQFEDTSLSFETRSSLYLHTLRTLKEVQHRYEDRSTSAKLTDAERADAMVVFIRLGNFVDLVRSHWDFVANQELKK